MQLLDSKTMKYSYIPCRNLENKKGVVVFCHGYAVTSEYFNTTADWIANNYDYYAVELEGMGITPTTEKPKHLSPKYYSQKLAHFISEDLNLENITLIGHSMGGGIVAMTANLIPEKIKTLVMISPMNSSFHFKLINSFRIAPTDKNSSWKAAKIIYKYPEKLFPLGLEDPGIVSESNRQLTIKQNTKYLFKHMSSLANGRALNKAEKNLSVNTYLVMSDSDRIIDANAAFKKMRKNPNIKQILVKDSGHVPFVDQFDQFKEILQTILDANN